MQIPPPLSQSKTILYGKHPKNHTGKKQYKGQMPSIQPPVGD
jgi:hypothetical protein